MNKKSDVEGADLGDEEGPLCAVCGSRESRLLHRWPVGDPWNPATIPITIRQCECKLVYLHPVPAGDQLPDAGDWWSPKRKFRRRNRRFKLVRERIQWKLFGTPEARFVRQTRKAAPSGRLLDVGCGKGYILSLATGFFDCVGLEPSPSVAREARDKGLTIVEATFEEAQFEPRSFDVVTMFSVIEHVGNPLTVLKKVNSILRANGVVALQTPKFGGPTYRRRREGWNGFRHGYHTFLFSGETLGNIMREAGFEVLRRPRRDRILDDILILWGRKVRDVTSSELD